VFISGNEDLMSDQLDQILPRIETDFNMDSSIQEFLEPKLLRSTENQNLQERVGGVQNNRLNVIESNQSSWRSKDVSSQGSKAEKKRTNIYGLSE